MDCNYTYNEKATQNILELAAMFYKATQLLDSSSAIFSAEEVQQSTVDKLTELQKFRTEIEEKVKLGQLESATSFITNINNAPIFHGLGEKIERLAPEYIEENRINKFIEVELAKKMTLQFDADKLPKVSATRLASVKKYFPDQDVDVLKYHLVKIEDILAIEEKTKIFGTGIHKLINLAILKEAGVLSNEYVKTLDTLIAENPEIFGVGLEAQWIPKINDIVFQVTEFVLQTGTPITELLVMSGPNDKAQIAGRLDLIAVDKKGTAHIFEVKISKNHYADWDDVKLLTTDWQLALYRQLLSKHVDVTDTMLYTIPIQLETLGDPTTLHYTGADNRRSASYNGLVEGGRLTSIARLLIPNGIHHKYNEEKKKEFLEDLDGLIPDYKIKTSREELDVDKIVAKAKAQGEYTYYNRYHENPEFTEKNITAKTEEEFREQIVKYVEYAKLQENLNVIRLRDAINDVIKDPARDAIKLNSTIQTDIANKMFKDYIRGNWEIVSEIPEATALGLIVLRNTFTNTIDVISMSAYNLLAESTQIDDLTYGELDHIKAMLFLNNFKEELFIGKGAKIGNIITYNPYTGTSTYKTAPKSLEIFKNRMTATGRTEKIKLNHSDHFVTEEKNALDTLRSSAVTYNGEGKNEVERVFRDVMGSGSLNDVDLNKLLAINEDFLKTFAGFRGKALQPTLNFNDPKEYLYALLQIAILKKHGADLSGDFIGMTNFALQFSDFKNLIGALFTKDQAEYDKNELMISGLMGGLTQVTPDFVRSNDLRNINLIIANVNSKIGQKMVDQSDVLHKFTMKYYGAIGYSGFSRNVIGESQTKHKNLFVLNSDGSISSDFRLKNPFQNDLKNALNDAEREYSQHMLFEIQKYMLNLTSDQIAKIDPTSLESLKSNTKIAEAIENGNYFKIPLVRREELSRNAEFLKGGLHGFWESFKGRLHEVNDFIDPRELDPDQLKYIKESAVGFTEMYDVYGNQTDEYKAKVLAKHKSTYFEWNLDTIAHRVAFNKIRKYQFDAKLPIINAYIWWLKLHGGKQNKELEKVMEYVTNQLKLAAFDEPIVDDEFKAVATVTAMLKKISTAGMLAFRPILLVKELTIGIMKGAGLAATQIYGEDQFNLGDLTKAYGKLMTIDNKFSDEFNLIDNINHYYRFANMDINTVAKKLQTDRRGIVRGVGRWMYSMNTIPDYYNRLSLFLAKMIHDGSYDAHTMIDGKMTYDVKLDKRFEHYLQNRDKHKDADGDYIPAKNDALYNKQRNLYLLLVEQLNIENAGEDKEPFTENDLIDKAYSEKERASFKSFTDMAYGYYDKDSQSQLNNTWYGMVWLQFMQFWPGKMKQWFGKPLDASRSPIGQFKQKTEKDENGVEVPLFKKPRLDEQGNYLKENGQIVFDFVREDTGDPLYEWTGSPQEGLMYSMLYTLHDVFTLNFTELKNNKQRRNRVLFGLHDAILMLIIAGIVKALFDAFIAENGTEGLSGETLQFGQAVSTKILRESNIMQNTLGAVNSEPVFISYASKVSKDFYDVLTGDRTVQEMMGRDIGAFEFLKG